MGWRSTTLTILNGQTASVELDLGENGVRRIKNLTFLNPVTLPETVVVQVAEVLGGTYHTLNDGLGADVTLLANKAQIQTKITAGALKLLATSGAVAADRVFTIRGAAEDVAR